MLLERFGPIVINITRVINDIFTVIFTYVVLMIAFSFGLVFILDGSSELLDDDGDGNPFFDENDGTWGTFLHNFANLMFKMMFIKILNKLHQYLTLQLEKFATVMFVIYCTRNPASRASERVRLVAIRPSSYVHRICNL